MPFLHDRKWTGWAGLLAGILLLGGCAAFAALAQEAPRALILKERWPQQASDLQTDPQTTFGGLPNGLRYILKTNQTPRDRVSMHLYIQSGSLAEENGEQGIAHFLEHMLFDGTTHFPPGEMVKYFQRIGMQFGPDANAHTGFGQTVFDILLPKGDAQSISEGLQVLSEFAQGALLLPDQVHKEKGVVLAEKRSGDSAEFRTFESTFAFELPGSLAARRLPIGREASINAFDARMLRRFYDAWYRPERMIVVMVGQFDQGAAKQMIEQRFGAMRPRAETRQLPDFGRFIHHGLKAFYHFEKESGATTVRIDTIEQRPTPADTKAYQQEVLLNELADWIVQRRLDKMVQARDSVLISAGVGSGDYLQQIRFAEITADCRPENWSCTLSGIEQELRKALDYGFTAPELERAKRFYHARLQREVNAMNTRDSKDISRDIMHSLKGWRVYQSAQQHMALLAPVIEAATLEQVHQAFVHAWSAAHRLILVTGNVDLSGKDLRPADQILSAYDESRAAPVQAQAADATPDFPYLPPPAAEGTIRERTSPDDLGIAQVQFANGVRLILKRTTFKENEVLAALSFGQGKSCEPLDQPGLSHLTEMVVNESGFGALDRLDLDNALAGRLADISLDVREDMFVVRGRSASSELPLLFQLLYTFVEDPGLRPEAMSMAMKRLEQKYRAFNHSVESLMQMRGETFLAGGDSRFGWPEWGQMRQRSLEQIRQWFGNQLKHAPLELVLVGDFQPQRAVELASRYFGSLDRRSGTGATDARPGPRFAAGQSMRLSSDSAIEKGLVVTAYPTEDFWDIHRTRRLSVLGELFSERLRVYIREKLGAAYSPYAYQRGYRAYPGYGLLQALVMVDPAQTARIADAVKTIAAGMAAKGITQDELRRALDPTLARIKDLRQSNRYWLDSVMTGSSRHPEQLEWARTIESDYAAIRRTEMDALARKYLRDDKAAVVIIVPQN